ncbi:kinase-like protein [Rickenella mellea]|uniref:non-specific serine/threonine protein kinase n=1 Tax=Rickenella mellea TaxID=50990 RepID=A0A4Y7Q4H5_9AGAM|nr:kinase-like protein [Rickenella mellea]
MLQVEVSTPSPESPRSQTLSDLSRNASVISSSSSSGSTSSLLLNSIRPRPIRTFNSPRSRSRDAPPTPRSTNPPAYLTQELGAQTANGHDDVRRRAQSRSKSRTKSRNSSVGLRLQPDDFEFGEVLGEGSYSTVKYAVYPPTDQEYAIKILDKSHLVRKHKTEVALLEKNVLARLGPGHPGIVRLHWTFTDEWSLFFVLDLAKNGDLKTRLTDLGSFSIPCARYYTAQLVDTVAYIHSKGIIHRDLKPENLLLGDNMWLKITDFGTGKILEADSDRATTFVGTAQYISPELLISRCTHRSSDLWAVGCIIYQMIAGRFAFNGMTEYLTMNLVKNVEYTFPEGFDNEARDLVQKLLVLDPQARLGAGPPGSPNDMNALRSHPFFASIHWDSLWKDPAPPMEPGMFQRPRRSADGRNGGRQGIWDGDAGAAWDAVVGDDVVYDDDDGVEWEGDGESEGLYEGEGSVPHMYGRASPTFDGIPAPSGPYGRSAVSYHSFPRSLAFHGLDGGITEGSMAEAGAGAGDHHRIVVPPNRVVHHRPMDIVNNAGGGRRGMGMSMQTPMQMRTSRSAGSSSSSSSGSPIERMSSAMDGLRLGVDADESPRGRDRALTPIASHHDILSSGASPRRSAESANTTADSGIASLPLSPGETLIFHSSIDVPSRARRLTATLLPRALPLPLQLQSQPQAKHRHLVLTSERVLCVKMKPRAGGVGGAGGGGVGEVDVVVKSEAFLKETKKEKEKKDARAVVLDVAPSGERGFVIITSSKSQTFSAETSALAKRWLREIRVVLEGTNSGDTPPGERSSRSASPLKT